MKNEFGSGQRRASNLVRSLVTAGLAGPPLMTAHAAVIYSGIRNIAPGTPSAAAVSRSVGVDIDDLGSFDLSLSTHITFSKSGTITNPDWATGVSTTAHHSLLPSPLSSFGILTKAGMNLPLLGLEATPVGAGGSFSSGSMTVPWAGRSGDFFGFRFNPSGTQELYGWGRLNFGKGGQTFRLVDWAYEDSGAPILTGATAVPEPNLSLLGLAGLTGAALRRRRQDNNSAPA